MSWFKPDLFLFIVIVLAVVHAIAGYDIGDVRTFLVIGTTISLIGLVWNSGVPRKVKTGRGQ